MLLCPETRPVITRTCTLHLHFTQAAEGFSTAGYAGSSAGDGGDRRGESGRRAGGGAGAGQRYR
jgi:hypothetical protein